MERKLVNKLMIVAAGGFVACFAMVKIFNNHVSDRIHKLNVFKEAMERLREHQGAKYLLGHPIVDSEAHFANFGLPFDDYSSLKVRVSGPKEKGLLFITAKPDGGSNMKLDTIQLQIGRDDSKRLVIKKSDETSSVS